MCHMIIRSARTQIAQRASFHVAASSSLSTSHFTSNLWTVGLFLTMSVVFMIAEVSELGRQILSDASIVTNERLLTPWPFANLSRSAATPTPGKAHCSLRLASGKFLFLFFQPLKHSLPSLLA